MKWISFAPWANISCWRPTCKTLCLVVDVKSKVIRMVDPGPIFRGGPTLEYTWFTEFRGDHFEAELAKYADMPACSTILWWARAYYDQSFHITRMLQLMIVISSTYVPNSSVILLVHFGWCFQGWEQKGTLTYDFLENVDQLAHDGPMAQG